MTEPATGYFTLDTAKRSLRGYLLPFNVKSKGTSSSNTAPITFPPQNVRIPRDPMVVSLNDEHERHEVIGRATSLTPDDIGVLAEFAIADTEEADEWIADHLDAPVYLSAEIADLRRAPGDIGSGRLAGAAVTEAPAFDGTAVALFSLLGDETEETPEPDTDEAPASEDTEPDEEPDDPEEDTVADATVQTPATFSRRPGTPAGSPALTREGYFRLMDDAMGGRATAEQRAFLARTIPGEAGMFALADVDYDGAAGVGAKMTPAQWIGEVPVVQYKAIWASVFATLPLTALTLGGFKWGVKPAGGTWTGNKDEIPTNTPTIVPVTDTASRWAGGHDIAREHRDFGTPGFFESYNAFMREDYEKWKDITVVRTEVIASATDVTADNPAGLQIGAGWSALIDGAATVVANGYLPTFALVEPSLWKGMMKTTANNVLGYLSAALGLEDGSLDGFVIRPAPGLTTGHVIVGSRSAATVRELPGSPIRAEALNIGFGGIDVGFFGYAGLLVNDPLGIVDVAPFA